jgi:outer membrane protein TolC
VFNPSQPDFWTMRLEPTETALYRPITVDVDAAVKTALEKRTDLVSSRKQLESNDINIRYFRDQIKPDVNASITYGAQALGGTQFVRGPGFPGDIIGDVQKSYPSTLKTLFAGDFPTWTLGVQVAYPIGASSAEASLARARLQNTQAQKQLQSQELQVQTQIREFARQVTTNAKRVDATRASRVLAERRLEAEEKKYQAGTSSSFFVLQAQRDLVAARNNELLAVLDHAKSAVDYETAQQAPLTSTGGITGVSTGTTIATGTTGTTGTQQQQQQ